MIGSMRAAVAQLEWRADNIDRFAERLVLALDDRAAARAGVVFWPIGAGLAAVRRDRIVGKTERPIVILKTV